MIDIAPLPNLAISELTKSHGLDQETIDRLLHIIYEDRPDYYVRMAQHEGSGNKKASDLFVSEFEEYMRKKLGNELDLTKTAVMTGIFWEVRRRARLMHGMSI